VNADNYDSALTIEKLKAAVELLKKQSVAGGDMVIFHRPYMGNTCSYCKHYHILSTDMYDHPFFNNNLEYLEYEHEKRLPHID